MTLDDAKSIALRASATGDVDPDNAATAFRLLLARCEHLESVVSDADALLEPIFLPRSGRTIYVDVRGHVLAGVLRRQA